LSNDEKINLFGKYKIETVIKKEGINEHMFRRVDKLPHTVKHETKSYEIKANGLFKLDIGKLKTIKNLLFLIRGEYMIIFREGETDPLLRFDSEVSPQVLKVARNSTAVKGMIKEWFAGKKFPINKWAFILIVATIGTIIYGKLYGYF
jgi:hypothetical protein